MSSHRSVGSTRSRRAVVGAVLAAAGAVALAAVPGTAAGSETTVTCHTGTVTEYGYRTTCLVGSFGDRARVGSIDATFAIRRDRQVIYAASDHGWLPVSHGKADYVKWVDVDSYGFQGVCVETSSGHLYYSSYGGDRGWLRFTSGCTAG